MHHVILFSASRRRRRFIFFMFYRHLPLVPPRTWQPPHLRPPVPPCDPPARLKQSDIQGKGRQGMAWQGRARANLHWGMGVTVLALQTERVCSINNAKKGGGGVWTPLAEREGDLPQRGFRNGFKRVRPNK